MAERVTHSSLDIERRIVARLVGAPEPGVGTEGPCVSVAGGPCAVRHRRAHDPALVRALSHRARWTDQPPRSSRQLAIPCVVGAVGVMALEAGTRCSSTAGTVRTDVSPPRPRPASPGGRRAAGSARLLVEASRTATGCAGQVLANVADGSSAATVGEAPAGRRPVPPSYPPLNRTEEPSVEEQAGIYGAVARALPRRALRIVRTWDAGSDKAGCVRDPRVGE